MVLAPVDQRLLRLADFQTVFKDSAAARFYHCNISKLGKMRAGMLLHLKKLPREMLLQLFSNSRAGCCPPIDLFKNSHTPPLNSCHRRIHTIWD